MTHLTDNHESDLEIILARLRKNHIHCFIRHQDDRVVELQTNDKELLAFAKKNNKDLK